MTTKPIRRPLFPVKLTIDSKYSTKRFFKNNYKILHSLEIDTLGPSYIIFQTSCCNLLNIAQRIKYSQKLYLQKEERHMKSKEALNLKISKKFKNIQALSAPIPYHEPKSLVHVANWLKVSKRLRFFSVYGGSLISKDLQLNFFRGFLNRLKKTKITHFTMSASRMSPDLFEVLLTFKKFPLSLRNLNLSWDGLWSDPSDLYDKVNYHKGLSHLKKLKGLKLSSPITLKTLQKLLLTVSNPSNLVSLDLNITFDDEEDIDALRLLKEGLEGYALLERLRLAFKTHIRTLRHLEFLQEYPIKHLHMQIEIFDESTLFQLGYAIKIQGLQTLALYIQGSFGSKIADAYFSLITQISELTQLRELTLQISTDYSPPTKIPGLLNAFGDCVERLSYLKYLSFLHKQVDFRSESTKLLSSLRQKAKHLTGLKLHFNNQTLQKSDVKLLLRLMQDSDSLEELNIDSFVFTEKEPLEKLSKTLSMIKPLRNVSFEQIGGNLSVEAFENMARIVLAKRGLENFFASFNWTTSIYNKNKQFKGINYSEALKSNPMLKKISIPSASSTLESCKWDQIDL